METVVNPVEYGKLLSKVESLEKKVNDLEADIKELLALAHQGKGGIWAGIYIASALSGVLSFIIAWWLKK
jgi:putative methionine-R-sulfoxide reductase with GAF domain